MTFTSPPVEAYEILLKSNQEVSPWWAIADLKMYGRSLEDDFQRMYGHYGYMHVFDEPYTTREAALEKAEKLIQEHREHCYSLSED